MILNLIMASYGLGKYLFIEGIKGTFINDKPTFQMLCHFKGMLITFLNNGLAAFYFYPYYTLVANKKTAVYNKKDTSHTIISAVIVGRLCYELPGTCCIRAGNLPEACL